MDIFYTYIYRDPSRNNEIIYVGKGKGKRAWDHVRDCFKTTKRHPFVHRLRAMLKNGVEPVIEFLCKDVDEELALLCEVEAISLYGRKDLGKGTLLNLTDGGQGMSGHIKSEKEIARLRGKRPPSLA